MKYAEALKAGAGRLKEHNLIGHPALHMQICRLVNMWLLGADSAPHQKRVLAKPYLDCFESVKWEAEFKVISKVKSSGDSKVD